MKEGGSEEEGNVFKQGGTQDILITLIGHNPGQNSKKKGLKTCKKKFLLTNYFQQLILNGFIAMSESCTIIPRLITASKMFYSRIVKDLISKLAARTGIVIKLFSGSSSVLKYVFTFFR